MVIGWLDASSGASGDMLLGALHGAGVPLEVMSEAVAAVAPEQVRLEASTTSRAGFAATRVEVHCAASTTTRTWRDLRDLLAGAPLAAAVRARTTATFERLATAEAAVHGTSPEEVHFHEVGALDAVADVVGGCAGLVHLGLARLVVSPVAVGSGVVTTAHGTLPVPPPAVVELLRGVPSYAGPVASELCTPTGAALLTAHASDYGPQPAMTVEAVGVGAGGRDPAGHANVLRLLTGEPTEPGAVGERPHGTDAPLVVSANVDDLDPRLWPQVLAHLLDAGASDAWLTPILMKKGRPAHTVSALVTTARADAVRRVLFVHTATIGLRETPVTKRALPRETMEVEVLGHPVTVKLALLDGEVVNGQPEYDDLLRVAEATGVPLKQVLAEALSQARHPQS